MHRMKSGTGDLKNHRSTLVKVGRRKVVRFARRLTLSTVELSQTFPARLMLHVIPFSWRSD